MGIHHPNAVVPLDASGALGYEFGKCHQMPSHPVSSLAVSTSPANDALETVRCFLLVVSEGMSPELRAAVEWELKDWEFITQTLQAVIRPQIVRTLDESVELSKQTLATYPESMHLIVGSDLLESNSLREPLRSERQRIGRGHLGVIHLGTQPPPQILELDGAVSNGSLKSEVRRIVRKLHYQRMPVVHELPCSPTCQRVNNRNDFEAALRLRYDVYHIMGYIPEALRSDEAGLELDNLDKYSWHYACYLSDDNDHAPAAVLRIITQDLQNESRRWVQETLARHRDPKFVRSSQASEFEELPVFHISTVHEIQDILHGDDCEYGEISRVVVGEAYRGLGLSRELIEFALTDAYRRGLRCVFLTCVPEHVPMYAKYGFLPIEAEVVYSRRVRQPARAMYRFLDF